MKQFRSFFLTFLLIFIFLFSSNIWAQSDKKNKKKCPRTVKVQVEKIEGSHFIEYKNFSTNFLAEIVEVKSSVSGKITNVNVTEGDLISKDWVIITINDALKDEIKKGEEEIARLEKKLNARRNWKVRSERAEAQTEKELNEAKANLDKLKLKSSDYSVKSYISGKIKSLKVNKDEEISEGSIVAVIVNNKKKLATVSIITSDLALFSKGQRIPIKLGEMEESLYAEVKEIGDDKVFLEANDPQNKIKESDTFNFRLVKRELNNVVVLPEKKILKDQDGSFAYIVMEKFAIKRLLKVGPSEKEKTLILEGLSIGDEIITTEINCLSDGKRIKVMVKDPVTGKYKVRKYKKVTARKVPIKKLDEIRKKREAKKAKEAIELKEEREARRVEKKKKALELKKAREAKRAEKKKKALELKEARDSERAEKKRKEMELKKIKEAEKAEMKKKELELKKRKCLKKVKVVVETIKASDFSEFRNFSADFSFEAFGVESSVAGKVTDINVSEGDLVSKDWVILTINNALKDEIKKAKEDVVKWTKTLVTRRNWRVRSKAAEDKAEASLNEAEAKVEELESRAPDYIITSPISGTIKSLKVEKDIEISEGSSLAEIINDKKMVATISITESDRVLFSVGQQIPFKIEDVEESFNAEVIDITDDKVSLVVSNSENKITESFTLNFRLVKEEFKNVVVLPEERILKDNEGSFVYIVKDKFTKKVYIKPGVVEHGNLLVMEGLSIGDEIIVAEILSAKEGTIKEAFKCIMDNIKVIVMEKDPKTGAFKKVRRVKVKKERIEIIERRIPEKLYYGKIFFSTNNFQTKTSSTDVSVSLWEESWNTNHKYTVNYSFSFGLEFSRKFLFMNKYIIAGLNFDLFSKVMDTSFEASIPNPFADNSPNNKSFIGDNYKLNQSNIYLSVLYPVVESSRYSGRVGLLLGISTGKIEVMDIYSFGIVHPFQAENINITDIKREKKSFSGVLMGIRLENIIKVYKSIEAVIRVGYIFTNKYDIVLGTNGTLTLSTNRIQFGLGFQLPIF